MESSQDLKKPLKESMSSFITIDTLEPIYTKTFRSIENKKESSRNKQKKMNYSAYLRLIKYALRMRFLVFWGLFFLILSQSGGIVLPFLSGKIMDIIINVGDRSMLNIYCFVFIGILLLSSISVLLRYFCLSLISEKVSIMLKEDAFKKFLSFDLEFFENHKTGELLSRIGSDIATLRWAIGANIASLFKSVILGIGSFIMMFYMNWHLALVVLFMMPILIGISALFAKSSKELTKKYQSMIADTSIIAEECFSNIRTVKSFAQEHSETSHFNHILNIAYQTSKTRAAIGGVYRSSVELITNIGLIAILWYGGYKVLDNELTSGQLVAFLIYSNAYSSSVGNISDSLTSIVVASGVAETLFELFDYKSKVIENKNGLKDIDIKGNIKFINAEFKYPSKLDVPVLSNFNLEIKEGERIALCGTSGSGKSTIVQLLQRFYDVSNGELLIDGYNIKDFNLYFLRKNIGFVSQEPILFSGTIEQNIIYGVENYTKEDLIEAADLSNSLQFIENKNMFPLGFDTLVGERGLKLSGGQKQRIAIARALIKKPKILIFDESTSALDAESEAQVQNSIDNLLEKISITVIIIAHRLSTIMNCKRILVMQGGKIIEEGSHDNLIENKAAYFHLVQKQMQGLSV